MAADFFLGESLVGDGNEVAHIDLVIGSKTGPAGAAFTQALSNQKDGFTTLLAVVTPNLPAKPDTILFNKVTIKGAEQAVQMFGPAQAAVARAVVDSVESGVIPRDKADDYCVLVGVFIHWDAKRRPEDLRLQLPGDQGVDPAGTRGKAGRQRSDRRFEDGQAPVQPEVDRVHREQRSRSIRRLRVRHLRRLTSALPPCANCSCNSTPRRIPASSTAWSRYDAGADEVMSYGGVTEDAVRDLVHGAIFTRGPKDLKNTAIFIGGTDMAAGERLLAAVRKAFFGPMRVSVMLDSNGCEHHGCRRGREAAAGGRRRARQPRRDHRGHGPVGCARRRPACQGRR